MNADEDVGHGAPSSTGAKELLRFAAGLGFDAIQLGPHGATSRGDASPYNGTLFSRNPTAIALAPLARAEWGEILDPAVLESVARARPAPGDRVAHGYAHAAARRALAAVAVGFRELRRRGPTGTASEIVAAFDAFRQAQAEWLTRDALYEILQEQYGGRCWDEWESGDDRGLLAPAPGAERASEARRHALLSAHRSSVEDYAIVQFIAHEQHRRFVERAHALGLAVYGDLQIGMSDRDAWAARSFLLRDWRMGAPPSRTDPGGQAWGFPLLDPRHYLERDRSGALVDGAALRFFRARVRKVAAEFDGLRVDHPHGPVSPWVYRGGPEPDA